jgi:hypothetical protein
LSPRLSLPAPKMRPNGCERTRSEDIRRANSASSIPPAQPAIPRPALNTTANCWTEMGVARNRAVGPLPASPLEP